MAIPREGFFELERGRAHRANYGLSVVAKVKLGREQAVRQANNLIFSRDTRES